LGDTRRGSLTSYRELGEAIANTDLRSFEIERKADVIVCHDEYVSPHA